MYKGKLVGKIGDMGAFSFYTAHQIVCGEGGMVTTQDDKLAAIIRSIKSHGRPAGSLYFDFQRIGFNAKMNDLEAALGLEGIETFDEFFNKRKNNLYKMLDLTKDLSDHCYFIREEKYEKVSPHAFPLVLKDKKYNRNKLYHHLESKGIQCKTLFGSLPTQHNAFKFLKYKYGDFPVSEYIGDNGLHFGMHQYINDDDLKFISDVLHNYFEEFR
jgi:dTDP-4-amino-4,6-dideoxygalactose transaminase